jgi:hypothetical protein
MFGKTGLGSASGVFAESALLILKGKPIIHADPFSLPFFVT